MPPITLLTDFGCVDSYVAQMKGVLLGIAPEASIVDVTHEIPPGNIRLGGLALEQAADAFPPATIHVAVIDPGVGSARRLVGVEAGGQRFLAPDNGLLTDVLTRKPPTRVHQLAEERFWRHPVSATFHGRDILAPVAAHWQRGIDLAEFGPAIERAQLVRLPSPEPRLEGEEWIGEVLAIDRFGNLITNLRSSQIPHDRREQTHVSIGGETIDGIYRFYAERETGALMALVGSSNRLEISINGGSAAERLGAPIGAAVRVRPGARGRA